MGNTMTSCNRRMRMTLTLIRIPTEEIIVIRPNMTTRPMRERKRRRSNSVTSATNNGAMTTTTKMNTKTSWINCLVFNEIKFINTNYRVTEILTSFIGSVHEDKKIFKENYLLCL